MRSRLCAGVVLALIARTIFLAGFPRARIPEPDRQVAPALAVCIGFVAALVLIGSWLVYLGMGQTHFDFGP